MDYFEKQRQLILSPIMYREKETFYLFVCCDRKKYTVNDKGICERWENDFGKLLMLLSQIDVDVSTINRDDFFTMETITLVDEINNWLEWLLNVDYTIPEQEKNKTYIFDVKAGTGKTFYTIAKVCDRADSIEKIKDYAEDSLPVLSKNKKIIGIITAQDVVEAVDDEMGEDYAKLAGLSAEEDLNETTKESMKKRLPWLVILLFLGMGVSTVVGAFEGVVAVLPVVICFQSLILDMAGNVGTQSLAVTIRVLMDENLSGKDKLQLLFKEMKVGFCNGALLGIMALVCLGIYIALFKGYSFESAFLISGCVGISLLVAIIISSLVGTLVPILFHKIKVDPAVASGPLITTVNDLVAVVTYYGLAWILLIQMLKIV